MATAKPSALLSANPTLLSSYQRYQRVVWLALALAPIAGSFVYNLGIRVPLLNGCPLLRHTGVPCPGWGLTRSFMAIARGDWQQAVEYHLFGPILFAAFLIAGLHLAAELIQNQKISTIYSRLLQNPKAQLFVLFMVFGYHGVRLHTLWRSGELYSSFMHSPLGQWLF